MCPLPRRVPLPRGSLKRNRSGSCAPAQDSAFPPPEGSIAGTTAPLEAEPVRPAAAASGDALALFGRWYVRSETVSITPDGLHWKNGKTYAISALTSSSFQIEDILGGSATFTQSEITWKCGHVSMRAPAEIIVQKPKTVGKIKAAQGSSQDKIPPKQVKARSGDPDSYSYEDETEPARKTEKAPRAAKAPKAAKASSAARAPKDEYSYEYEYEDIKLEDLP